MDRLWDIFEKYKEHDIYNGDETGLLYSLLPLPTDVLKGENCAGGRHGKGGMRMLLCCNVNGRSHRKRFVVRKARNPCGFSNPSSVPIHCHSNKTSWMMQKLFKEWLEDFGQGL